MGCSASAPHQPTVPIQQAQRKSPQIVPQSQPQINLQQLNDNNDPNINNEDDNILAIFKTLDLDGTGKISFEEFKAGTFDKSEQAQRDAFQNMDKDGTGFLHFHEFKEAYKILMTPPPPKYDMVLPTAPSFSAAPSLQSIPPPGTSNNNNNKPIHNGPGWSPQGSFAIREESNGNNEVGVFLKSIDEDFYTDYYYLFNSNGFDKMEALRTLTDNDLRRLGVEKEGHRRLILKEIEKKFNVTVYY